MMDILELIQNTKKELKKLKSKYKAIGSTYDLLVRQTYLITDIREIVEKSLDTEHYEKSLKLETAVFKFFYELVAEISMDDLKILAKHGNTDADWLIARKIISNKVAKIDVNKKTRYTIWTESSYLEYIYHLERGVIVANFKLSQARRMMELANQLERSDASLNIFAQPEKAATYLKKASKIGNDAETAEANFYLWNIYLDLDNIEIARGYLAQAVKYNHPEAVTAYARAHFGSWLVEKDESKAFKLLKKAHKLGDDWGTELLADCYAWGSATKENQAKAFKLRLGLTEDKSKEVCRQLGKHYLRGDGVLVDIKEGLRLIKKAMKLGDSKAYYEMAQYLSSLDGYVMHFISGAVEDIKDKKINKKRFNILKKSLELDEPYTWALTELADCYFYGDGTKQNFDKARDISLQVLENDTSIGFQIETAERLLDALDHDDPVEALDFVINKSCAADGDAQHQCELGVQYQEGKIIPRDDKEAVKWFKLAAKQGHPNAQAMLGDMYFNGHGTRKSYKEALKWYHLASQIGEAISNHNLGFMYETGLGVDRDNETAFEFYTIAAKQGIARSQNRLGAAHETGKVLSQDYKLTIKWYRLAANQGDAMGQNNLGVMYDQGLGVRKSLKKAFELYQLSAKQDYSPAQRHLGMMYQYGEGIPKSSEKAIEWYRRAAKKGYHYAQYNLGFFYKEGDHLAQSNLNAYVCFYLAQGDGSGWSEVLSTQYLNQSCRQVEHANEEILELEKSMEKSEITKAKALAEKCIMSAYQTWIW